MVYKILYCINAVVYIYVYYYINTLIYLQAKFGLKNQEMCFFPSSFFSICVSKVGVENN